MKKLLLILLAILPLTFIGCSGDDDNNSSDLKSKILGPWKKVAWKDGSGKWIDGRFLPEIYDFKSDDTYYRFLMYKNYLENDPISNGTYKIDGDNIIMDGGFKNKIVFSENGNLFTIGEGQTFERYIVN